MTYCIGTMLMYSNKLPIWSLFQVCARSLLFPTSMNKKKKKGKMRLTVRKSEKNRSLKQSVMPQKHVGNDLNRHTGKHAENTNTYDLFNLYF